MGRPSDYSPELAAEIAARLLEQTTLKQVCEAEDMPSLRTVMRWSSLHPEFQQMLDRARVDKADHVLEEALQISDETVSDNAQASRQRTRVDARLKVAAKLNPSKYAERLATGQAPELPQKNDEPISPLELARGLAFLLQKGVEATPGLPVAFAPPVKVIEPAKVEPSPARGISEMEVEEILRQHREEVMVDRLTHRGSAAEHGIAGFVPKVINRKPH